MEAIDKIRPRGHTCSSRTHKHNIACSLQRNEKSDNSLHGDTRSGIYLDVDTTSSWAEVGAVEAAGTGVDSTR